MKMKVILKFSDEERKAVNDFAHMVGLDVDRFCKQAVFFSINEGLRRANELESRNNSASRNAEGNTAEVSSSASPSTPALSNQTGENTNP